MMADISSEGHRKRLREKYLQLGGEAFLDYEILELLLSFSIARKDVKPLAKTLFAQFKSLDHIVDADISELMECEGLGQNSAILIKLIRSIALRYLRTGLEDKSYLDSSTKFCDFARMKFGDCTQEAVMAFFLDSNYMLVDTKVLNDGLVDCVPIIPALVAKQALMRSAKAVVLCHNHPSGHLKPSPNDNHITIELRDALAALNIHLLDHLIISKSGYYSYRFADGKKPPGMRMLFEKSPSVAE